MDEPLALAAVAPAPPHARWVLRGLGGALVLTGVVLAAVALSRTGAWAPVLARLGVAAFGWGPLVGAVTGVIEARRAAVASPVLWLLGPAAAAWLVGWALVALGSYRREEPRAAAAEPSGAAHAPPLAGWSDFHLSTLASYGLGILGAELVLVLVQTALASASRGVGWGPPAAFGVALTLAAAVAFLGGFVGASRSRKLSAPEATIAVLYLGVPLPALLSLLPTIPALDATLGPRFREVIYLANLLGRPELGYWLVFSLLVLGLTFGILTGFVATASGRLDLRTGFELFVARRHVHVFRPRLLLGGLVVLLLGIIPPLIILGILRAADAVVERTRIRELGRRDPLAAAKALHEAQERSQSPTMMMTALSVGGVGVGVMALIIVLSVMSGFEVDLQKKILGTNAHVVVLKYGDPQAGMPEYPEVMKKAAQVPGVIGKTPFLLGQVMVASEAQVDGAIIKGVDPETTGEVTDLPRNILPGGDIRWLARPQDIPVRTRYRMDKPKDDEVIQMPKDAPAGPPLPGILLGRELASSLRVLVGDPVTVVSPLGGGMGPSGPIPKSKAFRVAGIFYTGMFEYDSKFVYVGLKAAESFFGIPGATGVELKVKDVDDARRIASSVLNALEGYPYRTKDWGEMNRNLFSALRLEKLVMGIILSIIVVVAAGLIVATVTMLVLEKRKEISVLKALGVPQGGIVKIFLAEGLQIGIAGGLLGLFSGLAWCLFIERVGLRLDPEVYYIPSLPVKVEPLQTALTVLIAILVTYLASIYPALRASRVEPVEGLKGE
ncbi:MAG TPA: ABC transporter permease [Myxococcaceae bacterium]|nr:ABC transporter permease [Myxococcaceae bacterium]